MSREPFDVAADFRKLAQPHAARNRVAGDCSVTPGYPAGILRNVLCAGDDQMTLKNAPIAKTHSLSRSQRYSRPLPILATDALGAAGTWLRASSGRIR